MKCPSCQVENPEGMKFCRGCGSKLALPCPKCRNVAPPGSEFCNRCGSPLEGKVERAKPVIEAERKQVTVLFSDLSGYTAMTERLDPEEVKEIKGRIFGEIAQVVAQYEGYIYQLIGDQAMVLFGVPRVHEDDPFRAIQAAQEIHERIDVLSSQFEGRIGKPLSMHSGIHTGLVVTGELDLEKGLYGEITGDTINFAARLSDLAKAGEIFVGPETHRRTQGAFTFQALGPTQVQGKAKPIQIYKVLSAKERPATTRTGIGMKARPGRVLGLEMHGISSPLVGRDEEVSLLHDRIERLLSGQSSLVFVMGEAGLGKSRLVAEVRSHWKRERQPGALWLEGRALSFTQTMSYWPFQEIMREHAGITEEDGEETAWAKVEASVTTLFPPSLGADDLRAHEVLPYLASMLVLRVKGELEERVKYLDGEAMGRQIFLTSRRLFQRLAQQRPLVLVFEDWQWADQSSAELLEHLAPLIQIVPLLICVVSRPDPESPAMRLRDIAVRDYPDRYTEIALDALSPKESEKLLHNLLEMKDLSPHLCNVIPHLNCRTFPHLNCRLSSTGDSRS